MAAAEPPVLPVSKEDYRADLPDFAWALGRESWTFHRWFFQVYGRPMHKGEYASLLKQRSKAVRPN